MRLAERLKKFNMCSQAEPGKLDYKICEPGILFISLPIGSPFKLHVAI